MQSESLKSIWTDKVDGTVTKKVNINDISRSESGAAYFLMSAERRKRCDSLKRDEDKRLCIAADMLLRRVISEETGLDGGALEFVTLENGKPVLKGGAVHFSISHSGEIAAVAVNKHCRVGIDVEKIVPVNSRIARRVFCDEEIAFVFGSPDIPAGAVEDREALERFFRVWTYKEAYVKMTGQGITDDIKSVRYCDENCRCEVFDGYCLSIITEK